MMWPIATHDYDTSGYQITSKWCQTMVYLLPIIIHFWLSNHFKNFQKMFLFMIYGWLYYLFSQKSENKQIWCDHGVLATHYYTLLVIKSLQNFQKMFWDGYTTYFRKKRFDFFEKSQIMFWGNWMRNPSYMDIFCLANYPADEVLQDVQGVLKICIQTFTSYNTKMLSYLRSMCCKIIITIRVNKEIKNLGMKCNKRVMKQAWPNQFRHI